MSEPHELEERAIRAFAEASSDRAGIRAILNLVREEQMKMKTVSVKRWWLSHTARETSNA